MMDELIIREIIKTMLIWAVLFLCSAAIMIFFMIGVYDAFWNVPGKVARIAELTTQRDVWQARAKELDKYIAEQDKKYRVATKFDQLFMLVADPGQVMDFENLNEYIKNKKEFYKTNNLTP